jgi:hypothetical protein
MQIGAWEPKINKKAVLRWMRQDDGNNLMDRKRAPGTVVTFGR